MVEAEGEDEEDEESEVVDFNGSEEDSLRGADAREEIEDSGEEADDEWDEAETLAQYVAEQELLDGSREELDQERVEEAGDDGSDQDEPDVDFESEAIKINSSSFAKFQGILHGRWGREKLQADYEIATQRFKSTQGAKDKEFMEERQHALEAYDEKEERLRELDQ